MIVVSSVNQKGGTGKTTMVFHLSYILAKEVDVMVIDLDPQATLTVAYGVDPEGLEMAIDTVLESYARRGERTKLSDVMTEINFNGSKVDLVPAREYLEGLNITLSNVLGREKVLLKAIKDVDDYDVIIIDCQPTFSLLTINAMVASDYILIPVETAYFSIHGLLLLLDTVEMIREELNPELGVLGIVPIKYDRRLKSSRKNLERIMRFSDRVKVYPPIPVSTYFERAIEERKTLYEFEGKTAKEGLRVLEEVSKDILKALRGGG